MYGDDVGFRAGADLSAGQYKAVTIGGTIAANNTTALGLLQNKPQANEDASMRVAGRSRYRAGAAVDSGSLLMVTTSGWLIAVTSGSLPCGQAFEGVSSGSIGEGYFNFAVAKSTVSG